MASSPDPDFAGAIILSHPARLTGGPPFPGHLNQGGGNGTSDGMEARIAKLEAHMEHVRSDLAKLATVPADLAGIKADLANLPTKDYLSEQFDKRFTRQTTLILSVTGVLMALVTAVIKLI